ncbi:MAG: ATP-binding protein, partial [Bdellovibrionales bacterium]
MKHKILPHLYETVAKEALFGIVVFDDKGECLFINASAIQLFGMQEPNLKDIFPEEDKPHFKSFSDDLLKHEGLYQDILVRKAGGTFVAHLGIKHLEFDGTHSNLIMLEDVTLQKKMQREITAKQNEIKATFEEILKQNRQLKELDHAKDRFIALTTHELRTPLSAMCASAEILKLKLYDTPEQMQEFIDMIYEQGGHLQELVNDILDFAKIQAGKMDFFIELQDVEPLIHGIVKNFEGMAETNQVRFVFEAPSTAMKCYYDEVRLRQVISNIVNNAIKYNRPGGTVRVYFEDHAEIVKVFVQDSGKGIPADQFDKVFNEFETIGMVAEHHKGTGLGMPISRKLTEGMGGKLCLSSVEGVGSIFWIEIPKTKVLDESVYKSRLG